MSAIKYTVVVGEHELGEDGFTMVENTKYIQPCASFDHAYNDLMNTCAGHSIARIEIRDGDFVTDFNFYSSVYRPLLA